MDNIVKPIDLTVSMERDFLRGAKGDKGDIGEQGVEGPAGYTPVKGVDYFTEDEIKAIADDVLNRTNVFDILVVDNLPVDNINDKAIYFVPKEAGAEETVYDEYMFVGDEWRYMGSTDVDFSKYYLKDEVDAKITGLNENKISVDDFNAEKESIVANFDTKIENEKEERAIQYTNLTNSCMIELREIKTEVINYSNLLNEAMTERVDNEVRSINSKNTEQDEKIEELNQTLTNSGVATICKNIGGKDLNTICGTKSGFYSGSNLSHAPNNGTGNFIIMHMALNETYQTQVAYSINSIAIYSRRKVSSGWEEWSRINEKETVVNNDNGTAIKYPDGRMVCTKKVNLTGVDVTTQSGALYVSASQNLGNYAAEFIETPIPSITLFNSWAGFITHNDNLTKTGPGKIEISRTTSATNCQYTVSIEARGKWK